MGEFAASTAIQMWYSSSISTEWETKDATWIENSKNWFSEIFLLNTRAHSLYNFKCFNFKWGKKLYCIFISTIRNTESFQPSPLSPKTVALLFGGYDYQIYIKNAANYFLSRKFFLSTILFFIPGLESLCIFLMIILALSIEKLVQILVHSENVDLIRVHEVFLCW